MRKKLMALAFIMLPAAAALADNVVTVRTGTGTRLFGIDDINRINFGEETITFVEKDGGQTPFFYDDITEITFDDVPAGVESVTMPDALPAGTDGCDIYSLSGHKMNGSALQPGIYIIRKGTKVTKFVKR